jgi:integrase
MKLTTTTVKTLALPPGAADRTYFDDSLPAFGLRVRAGGARTWVVQFDVAGKTRRMSLGTVAALDLGEARKRARDILAARTLGRDPASERRQIRAQQRETFGALLLERYLPFKREELRPRSFKEVERHLVKHARPLHPRPITSITRREIATLVDALKTKTGASNSNYVLGSLSGFFGWLLRRGMLDGTNPAAFIDRAATKPRQRLLTDAELKEIWQALDGSDRDYADVVKLLTYTCARKSELGGLRYDELDLDAAEIRLPPQRCKNGEPHLIPLAPQALAVLKARVPTTGRPCVFGRGATGLTGWSHRNAALVARINAARTAAGVEAMPAFVLHDLRRCASTGMAEHLNIMPHVVESVLGHVSGDKIARTYNLAGYAAEKRRALERWADYVDAVVSGKAPGTVVRLRG